MHKFPKDADLRRQWVKFVQVKRADSVEPTNIRLFATCIFLRIVTKKIHGGNGAEKTISVTFFCCTDDTVSSSNKFL